MATMYVAKKDIEKAKRLLANPSFRSISGKGLTDYEDTNNRIQFRYTACVAGLPNTRGTKVVTAQCYAEKDDCGNLEISVIPEKGLPFERVAFEGIAEALDVSLVSRRSFVHPQTRNTK